MKRPNIERAMVIFFVAGVGFFIFAFMVTGALPWFREQARIANTPPAEQKLLTLNAEQMRGRQLYMANGCDYCHSQFVRPVGDDPLRYGASSEAWEYANQYPHLLGTRRIGPDLTREGGVHTNDWQYAHLFDARMIVPWSIMPGYSWMFHTNPSSPGPKAKAIVAYLQTLGRARKEKLLSKGELKKHFIPGIGTVTTYVYHGGKLQDPGYDGIVYLKDSPRPPQTVGMNDRGRIIYQRNCAACHGASGNADGSAAKYLAPAPVRLSEFRFNPDFVYKVLYYGRPGTAMPSMVHSFDSFLPPKDLWAVSYYIASGAESTGGKALSNGGNSAGSAVEVSAVGKTAYASNCAACHGIDGDGNGAAARALTPAPIDFQNMQPSAAWAYHDITEGRKGTAMPSFSYLPEATRKAIGAYIRTFFKPTNTTSST